MAVTLLRQKQIGDRLAVVISNTDGFRGHASSFQTYSIEDGQHQLELSGLYKSDLSAIKAFDNYVAKMGETS